MTAGIFYNGQQYTTPQVLSAVNDSAMSPANQNVGTKLVLVGTAKDGQPGVETEVSSPAQAQSIFISGDLVDACRAAFNPSDDDDVGAPSTISCIRVVKNQKAGYGPTAILGLSWTSGTVTVQVASTSNMTNGDQVTIAGCTPSGYNGSGLVVTVVDPTHFSYPLASNPGAATVLGTYQCFGDLVQASTMLKDGAGNNAISVQAQSWGRGNNMSISVANGSKNGYLVTVALGAVSYSQDNIHRNLFTIQYSGGAASAQMTISNATLTLYAPSGTQILQLTLANFNRIDDMCAYINANAVGFAATPVNGYAGQAVLNNLDKCTTVDVKTGLYTATGNIQAVVDYLNSAYSPLTTNAQNLFGVQGNLAVVTNTPFSGEIVQSPVNGDWSNAFTLMQTILDCRWLCALSSSGTIGAMADAHAQYMSTIGRSERRNFFGMASGTTDDQALAQALLFNSDRTGLIYQSYMDYPVGAGNGKSKQLNTYAPYILAALVAGGFAGAGPGTPLTGKSLIVRGLAPTLHHDGTSGQLRVPSDTDALINGGVFCVVQTPDGFEVVQSVSTWLNDNSYDKVEISTGSALDYVLLSWRAALKPLIGKKGTPDVLAQAISISETCLNGLAVPEPNGPGVLAGDSTNPPFQNLSATLVGDVIAVTGQVSPVIPVNYVTVTVYAVPYSGSASA